MARHDKRFSCLRRARKEEPRAWLSCIAAVVACLLPSGDAHAYDEQASLDLALGYALTVQDDTSTQGASVDVGASLGLSDAVVARATLGYATLVEPRYAEREVSHLGRLRVEGLYLLDVLKVVPFFGLGVTLTNSPHDAAALPVRPGGHLLFGVDYLASRSWIVGVDVRSALLFEGDGHRLNATDVALRVSRLFETF
ncbi:MAG: hypothetical protein RLZZ450_6483 [Pseudomonadota bacterium]|jgi:hypothetical protein